MIVGGLLTPLEDILTSVLEWFHNSVGLSWAWSIVALTIAVRLVILPLTVKQIHSMQNLQVHAPEMKEIQQRWKHDKQRQNEELMKFYKDNKINPAASCLPIVAQFPVFIALFYTLRGFEKEILPNYPDSSLEFVRLVNITDDVATGWGPLLLLVYIASQLTSTYFMSQSIQQKAQRYLMFALPIIFVPFMLRFPSGLLVYWVTSNLWSTGQGVITRRLMPKPDPDALKRSSRTPAKPAAPASTASGDGKPKTPPASSSSGQVAGPPRRVKRKRSGGGGRR
ncbi:MAG: YidC/Oxa1 family membrane protein insertase [Gaiellales bacterium]